MKREGAKQMRKTVIMCAVATLASFFIGCGSVSVWAKKGIAPAELRCEYATNPLGIDAAHPRFSWKLISNQRGQVQSAYQVLVGSNEENLKANRGDIWDSGKVNSDQSIHIVYGGKPLGSGKRYYWKVRVWNATGQASAYSDPTWWEMGLLKPEDWSAKWIGGIGGKNLFRKGKEFVLNKTIKRARVYISGLGYYELRINGDKVGGLPGRGRSCKPSIPCCL